MSTTDRKANYLAITKAIQAQGFQVIEGYGKGGFWVRNPDMSKPIFVNENSFLPYANAKKLFS